MMQSPRLIFDKDIKTDGIAFGNRLALLLEHEIGGVIVGDFDDKIRRTRLQSDQ